MIGPQFLGPQCCPLVIDFSDIANLCLSMPRPLLITGLFVNWMRKVFSAAENIENPLLQQFIWNSDITLTQICIESVYKWQPALVEMRPGIFVKRGGWKVLRYGIDDRKLLRTTNIPCFEQDNSFFTGSSTLFVVGGESAEVELLATEVYRAIMQGGPAVRKIFNFLRLVVAEIGEVSILEESKSHFVCPIVVSYGCQDTWQICTDNS